MAPAVTGRPCSQSLSKAPLMNFDLRRIRSATAVLLLALGACGGGSSDDSADAGDPVPALQRNDPVRDWTFSLYESSATTGITRSVVAAQDGSGTQVGDLMKKLVGFGPTGLLDEELFLITEIVASDGQANGYVFSTAGGATYGANAEAPFGKLGGINQPGGPHPIGGNSSLLQRQSFIKRSDNARINP